MTSVLELLSLPANSNGFTALRDSITDTEPSSPPHKALRRDADVDSPSAARAAHRTNQPVKIQLIGDLPNHTANNSLRSNIYQCIKVLLTKENMHALPATYENIYNDCLWMVCVLNQGEGIYEKLRLELEQTVSRLSKELVSSSHKLAASDEKNDSDKADKVWIREFVKSCEWFETQVALLQSLLTYLDQVYIRRAQIPNIRQLAFSFFIKGIFENVNLMEMLRRSVSNLVSYERKFRLQNTTTNDIPSVIYHLLTHQQYSVFEEYYADLTRKYYQDESKRLITEEMKNDAKKFFERVQSRIEEEVERAKRLLPVGSWSLVRDATLRAFLDGRMQWLAQETVGDYLINRDFKNLKTMYELFSDADGSKVICTVFKTHLQTSVQAIVKDSASDDTMVERLLDLQAIADSAIQTCFLEEPVQVVGIDQDGPTSPSKSGSTSTVPAKRPNQVFVYALADAFTRGFRARRNKPAEMIARHMDKLMRKGQGAMSDSEFDTLLDLALGLYRFTDDKDVFRGFYLRALAKRLLLAKSASSDFEAAMLKKLRDEYDPEFDKGQEMFTDLSLSRETMLEYHSKLPEESEGHRLSVMVLKQSAWPYSEQTEKIILPLKIQKELDAFEWFYKDKHTGRRLYWQHSVATVTMTARFKAGSKELSVSLYQSLILLLFNDSPEISFAELVEQTQLSDPVLRITLQSLACGKKKVLLKIPAGRDINDRDIFWFNDGFVDPRAKVHINSIQAKVTPEESKRTQTAIDGDRAHYLDAAVVRIMKAKKEMAYEKLLSATVDAVKSHFVPDVKAIKERIDRLMEQEYVRRDDDRPQMLVYVA